MYCQLSPHCSGAGDGIKGARAITAGIVGSVLFFVTAIVLSVCIVKICNKRKRRQMEKGLNDLFDYIDYKLN